MLRWPPRSTLHATPLPYTTRFRSYLDGFEPLEPMLTAPDATLMRRIESGMGELRAALQRGQSADQVASRVQVLDGLFDDAEVALSPDAASDASTFIGAFTKIGRAHV